MPVQRRFPPPWRVEPHPGGESFIIRDAKGQAPAYVYFEDEPIRQMSMKHPSPDEARRHRSRGERPMKATVVVTILALVSPVQAKAAPSELTLNCEYEKVWHMTTNQNSESSGNFSVVIRMQTDGTASIDANTAGCALFVGSFSELSVGGECENTINTSGSAMKVHSLLYIDRVSGAFEHTVGLHTPRTKDTIDTYSGHCAPAKKLF
jgi:hypothetical protein